MSPDPDTYTSFIIAIQSKQNFGMSSMHDSTRAEATSY